jgi:predicted phosphohydrolase
MTVFLLSVLLSACQSQVAENSSLIKNFEANTSTITPGQEVIFTWSIQVSGNGLFNCSLDVESDSNPDYSFDNCQTTTSQAHSYAAEGNYTATLTLAATDSATTKVTVTALPTPNPVTFAAVGDFGAQDDRAGTIMNDVKTRSTAAFLLLGDVSYSELMPESAWCEWVHSYLGHDYPMQLMAGNHEEDSRTDGFIHDFTACMPDRLNSELGPGGYGVNYAFDLGIVTIIAIAADLTIDDVKYNYDVGSSEHTWLLEKIRTAKSEGDWVVVGTHKPCISIGNKTCEIGQELAQLFIDEKVDLVLHGHDHDYQRSHALAKLEPDTVPSGAIADDGSDGVYVKGAGTVFVIAGTAGRSLTDCSVSDTEFAYVAAYHCGETSKSTKGYLLVNASTEQLEIDFIATVGSYSDTFIIGSAND